MSNFYAEAQAAAKAHFASPHDQQIFLRQMKQEAGFTDATSPAGAQGPAQIMPATARGWGVKNVHDPREAYGAAARNMAKYLRSYGGDWAKALTAYNAGPGAVGGPLPAETQNYIRTILGGSNAKAGKTVTDVARTKAAGTPATKGSPGGTDTSGALVDELLASSGKLRHVGSGPGLLTRLNQRIATGAYTTAPTPGTPATPKTTTDVARAAAATTPSGTHGKVTITGADPGRIQPGTLSFLEKVAGVYGQPLTGDSGAGHSRLTTSGNVSEHNTGHAVDVPATGAQLMAIGRAALIAAGMDPKQAAKAQGGLYNLTTPNGVRHQIIFNTHIGGDHTNHVHISAAKR